MKKLFLSLTIVMLLFSCEKKQNNLIEQSIKSNIITQMPTELGFAGPFAGIIKNPQNEMELIVAGGANFPIPIWKSSKVWYDDIYIYNMTTKEWKKSELKLPQKLAYGSNVTYKNSIYCFGGNFSKDENLKFSNKTFSIKYENNQLVIKAGANLPEPSALTYAAINKGRIYVAAGTNSTGFLNTFISIDISNFSDLNNKWETHKSWPGKAREAVVLISQNNGSEECLYLIGGRSKTENWEFLNNTYEYSPQTDTWKEKAPAPAALMAGHGNSVGQCHLLIPGADTAYDENGEIVFGRADELKDNHPGFAKNLYLYNTITDKWITVPTKLRPQVHSFSLKYTDEDGNLSFIIPSGEIQPRIRTKNITKITFLNLKPAFGATKIVIIVIYLLIILGIGVFFSFKNKNADDYFKGGQKIPYWVAAFSIFATMLSSITFISTPAKAFSTNWVYFILILTILIVTPFVSRFYLPFFRKLKANSAYEYLELRFNVGVRLFASLCFIIFQIMRMAIVMYLPALALSAITPLTIATSILIMGILSILYCTFGGLEAVVWTDTIQSIVLLGGAAFTLILIISGTEGGFSAFFSTATEASKFTMVNKVEFSDSLVKASLFVIILGGIGNNFVSYSSDMSIIQRYMSVKDEKAAKKSMWTNALLSVFASALFFAVGTALYVFYKNNPAALSPTMKMDQVFPIYIANEMPPVLSGLVVAAVLAAAQSTISTSMNSTSAAITTDFVQRLSRKPLSEKKLLQTGRITTFILGLTGTAAALLIAFANVKSAWDIFMQFLGLITGGVCGLFVLGIFSKRANHIGAFIGVIISIISLLLIQNFTEINGLLYAFLCFSITATAGYIASLILNAVKPQLKPDSQTISNYSIFK